MANRNSKRPTKISPHLKIMEISPWRRANLSYLCKQQHTKTIKTMDIEQVRLFALSLPQTTEDMPYGPDWLIFRIAGKIFLHLRLDIPQPTCAVKLPPEEGMQLREQHTAIEPAYHLNKTHWSDLQLEKLDSKLIESLITKSYLAVVNKLPKKVRDTIPWQSLSNINYD